MSRRGSGFGDPPRARTEMAGTGPAAVTREEIEFILDEMRRGDRENPGPAGE